MLELTGYDLIQIALLLVTCYSTYRAGITKGVSDTLEYLEEEGIVTLKKEDEE